MQAANPSSLVLNYVYGMKNDACQVMNVDQHRVIYPAGHNIVLYDTEQKAQQFFPGLEGTQGVTCMALSPSKRYLAVAEKADRAIIFVYDLQTMRRKKTLTTTDCMSSEYISIAFATGSESKYLISMGGGPDWILIYWQWERPKVLSTVKVSTSSPVYQVSFNIHDTTGGIIATGNNVFRWYKYQDSMLKSQNVNLNKKETTLSTNFQCHAWLHDGKLVVGTENGEVLIFDQNCDYKGYLSVGIDRFAIECICAFSKGFLVGGDDSQAFIFEKNPEDLRSQYAKSARTLQIPTTNDAAGKIKWLCLNGNQEDTLYASVDNSQIYSTPFNSDRAGEDSNFTYLLTSFHSGIITGLDVCVRKPLIATCGLDKTVRIWNYEDKTIEVMQRFNEEPHSVAFHPSGFQIIVGFADKLRLMNVFSDCIKTYKELPIKACREIRFSNGGHLFAATNGHIIQIFNFYTGENPPNMLFKRHSGKVRSIAWADDDQGFVSAGWDGSICEWALFSDSDSSEMQTVQFYNQKGTNFSCVLHHNEHVYCVGNDRMIKEIHDSESGKKLDTGVTVGQLGLTHIGTLLFAGVAEPECPGAIRAYNFMPLTGDYTEYQAHSLPVERVRISQDDKYVFSAGQDGTLCIFEITHKETKSLLNKEMTSIQPAKEIIITKGEIDELNLKINDISMQMKELSASAQTKYMQAMHEKDKVISSLETQFRADEEMDKQRLESLIQSTRDIESQYSERMYQIDQQNREDRNEIEENYHKKLQIETNRYQQLTEEKEEQLRTFAAEINELKSEHKKELTEIERSLQATLKQRREEIIYINAETNRLQQEFEDERTVMEQDNDWNLEQVRQENFDEVRGEEDKSDEAKGNLKLMKKKYQNIQVNAEELKNDIDRRKDSIKQQEREITIIKKEKVIMQNEVKVRDRTIGDKEKRIFDLKKKNAELEKFKFVLDYKIKELKREIIPREEEISKMKEQTTEMDKELKHLTSVNENLGLMVDDLRMRQSGMDTEIQTQKGMLKERATLVQNFKDGVYENVQFIQEHKKLKEGVVKLYNKHIRTETKMDDLEEDIQKEHGNQRKYLEKNVNNLKLKIVKEHHSHKTDNMRIMRENVELLGEINKLRKDVKYLERLKRHVENNRAGLNRSTEMTPGADEHRREIEMQRSEIRELRNRVGELEQHSAKTTPTPAPLTQKKLRKAKEKPDVPDLGSFIIS